MPCIAGCGTPSMSIITLHGRFMRVGQDHLALSVPKSYFALLVFFVVNNNKGQLYET